MSCFSNMLFCVSEMNLPEMSMKWQGLEGGNVTGGTLILASGLLFARAVNAAERDEEARV
jgi:hypothetical protein